jgi:hypothetical protein
MARTKKNDEFTNLRGIEGHTGLYTFIDITRNPRKEKVLLGKMNRDTRKLREEKYIARNLSRSSG